MIKGSGALSVDRGALKILSAELFVPSPHVLYRDPWGVFRLAFSSLLPLSTSYNPALFHPEYLLSLLQYSRSSSLSKYG